ncbi:hypothetical protein [Rhizobium leucaenae]|uniref:VanZ family protein n=1 Tax=Rhizobium leucaenae TaxID=29450 RepID=A0A7W6ZTD5_9HYPH|nr:hypothetical protein [Rhizobium leucaenae]MBB4568402.1 hypothetical protein [Rhizobium leucaenae]MBB6300439.1 hypothetical protein [Rhizobium leucaenae]
MKILAWSYIAALVAVTLAHLNLQAQLGDPFNMYRAGALCVAGMLARLAYPQSPSFTCLLMIGSVSVLGLSHFLATGSYGSSMDIIVDMSGGLWGIAIGAMLSRLISPTSKRTALY